MLALIPVLAATVWGVVPAGASGGTGVQGVTDNTITLGIITSLTGSNASVFTDIVPAATARIDLQNAHGGVDGRKIKLIVEDDHSSPATNAVASTALLSKGVFGVIDEDGVVTGGYKVFQQAGVPVTGGGFDGPEWGEQPNTNMFSITAVDPHYPANTALAQLMKRLGATRVASFGYDDPSSTASAEDTAIGVKKVGLTSCYLDTSIPLGSVAVAPIALSLKSANCNGAYLAMATNTNFAILTAAKQAGVPLKVAVSATGYGQALLTTSAANQSAQGTYFQTTGAPVEVHTKATEQFEAALAKYAHLSGIPSFSSYEGWAGADLMIKGLELAGKNPTRTAFIKNLRKVTKFTTTGLTPPVNLTTKEFGQEPEVCDYYVKLTGTKFDPVPATGKPICAKSIPGTTQVS